MPKPIKLINGWGVWRGPSYAAEAWELLDVGNIHLVAQVFASAGRYYIELWAAYNPQAVDPWFRSKRTQPTQVAETADEAYAIVLAALVAEGSIDPLWWVAQCLAE